MKVCMFARSMPAHATGGMETHIETLSKELVKSGIDVTIITTFNPLGLEYENRSGVKIHYLKGTMPGRYEWGYYEKSAAKFAELQKSEKFDLIHSQSAGAYYILKNGINRRYNIPVIVSLHGTSIDEIKTKLRLGVDPRGMLSLAKNVYNYIFRDRQYLRSCDAVIATSDSQVGVIKKYYGISEGKINLIYNGIDDELFIPLPLTEVMKNKYRISHGSRVIAAIARLKKEKGVQNIISILPAIREAIPSVKLLIGGNGEYKEQLEKMVDRLGLKDNVEFLGRIEYKTLPEVLNCANVFVNPTIRENGYDLTIPQAMSCAKPVVSSDVRSIYTVIENGKNGFIYKRDRLEELRSLVLKILTDEKLQKEIGIAGRKTVEEKFNLKSMALNTMEAYKRVLERTK